MTTSTSPSLSRPLYFPKTQTSENISRYQLEPAYKIAVYADIVQAQAMYPPQQKDSQHHNKTKLHGFSDGSRHAMIEFLAKIEDTPDLFVTLTYSDDIAQQWYLTMREHFEAFRKRLEYYYPEIRAMWRIEFVPRKSGHLINQLIPHWHLLVWLPKDTPQERKDLILKDDGQLWRNAWHAITHSQDSAHLAKFGCLVEPIKSRKHAYAYCSKYLAKENEENVPAGRRWGRIGTFEQYAELETELTQRQYVHFKRMLNAYLKAEALKRYKRQKVTIPYRKLPLSHFMKFYKHFVKMNVSTGCSVFGLGYVSQEIPIGKRTIYKIIAQARVLASDEHPV